MTRRMALGIAAGLMAAAVLVGVGMASYRAGMGHRVAQTVGDGEVVRVIGSHHWGPPFGLFFFVLLAGVVLFALSARSRGPYAGWGPSGGPCGTAPRGPEAQALEDWHRRAHGGGTEATTAGGAAPTPSG